MENVVPDGMMLLEDAAKELGITVNAVRKRLQAHKEIPRGRIGRGKGLVVIGRDALQELSKLKARLHSVPRAPARRYVPRAEWWKVSVYDDNAGGFIVRRCSMTRSEAMAMAEGFLDQGLLARASPH